jgi:putative endonuclease
MAFYFVYILECNDCSLYTGYTKDLTKRVIAHNTHATGAKYTKARRPVVLKYFEKYKTLSRALKREHAIKKLTREEKLKLISEKVKTR